MTTPEQRQPGDPPRDATADVRLVPTPPHATLLLTDRPPSRLGRADERRARVGLDAALSLGPADCLCFSKRPLNLLEWRSLADCRRLVVLPAPRLRHPDPNDLANALQRLAPHGHDWSSAIVALGPLAINLRRVLPDLPLLIEARNATRTGAWLARLAAAPPGDQHLRSQRAVAPAARDAVLCADSTAAREARRLRFAAQVLDEQDFGEQMINEHVLDAEHINDPSQLNDTEARHRRIIARAIQQLRESVEAPLEPVTTARLQIHPADDINPAPPLRQAA